MSYQKVARDPINPSCFNDFSAVWTLRVCTPRYHPEDRLRDRTVRDLGPGIPSSASSLLLLLWAWRWGNPSKQTY